MSTCLLYLCLCVRANERIYTRKIKSPKDMNTYDSYTNNARKYFKIQNSIAEMRMSVNDMVLSNISFFMLH